MAVYVDQSKYAYGRMIMCHMMADTLDELHLMAERIGIRREHFQEHAYYPHYDICKSKREIAVALGAIEIRSQDLIRKFRHRRTGEKK